MRVCAGEVRDALEKLEIWWDEVKKCYVVLEHVHRTRVDRKSLGIALLTVMLVM